MLKSVVFNFLGQTVSIAAALVGLPIALRCFGPERFGLLTLAISFLSAAGVLDLGLSRSTTKYVAERDANSDLAGVRSIIWASVLIQSILGVLAAGLYLCIGPVLIPHLDLNTASTHEVTKLGGIIALTYPFTLMNGVLRGGLEGRQMFGIVNVVKCLQNGSIYLIPALCGLIGYNLEVTVVLLAVSRLVVTALYAIIYTLTFPNFWVLNIKRSLREIPLFRYSGWITVSNTAVALITNGDRFLLAALCDISTVGYYALLMEVFNGATVIAGNVTNVLFPVFSRLGQSKIREDKINATYMRGLLIVLLCLIPVVFVIFANGSTLFAIWQGATTADICKTPLKFVAIAVLVSSIGWVPTVLILGLGQPSSVAKIQIVQIGVLFAAGLVLYPLYGLLGAAIVLLIRVMVESIMLLIAAGKYTAFKISEVISSLKGSKMWRIGSLTILLVTFMVTSRSSYDNVYTIGLVIAFTFIYIIITLPMILEAMSDRDSQ